MIGDNAGLFEAFADRVRSRRDEPVDLAHRPLSRAKKTAASSAVRGSAGAGDAVPVLDAGQLAGAALTAVDLVLLDPAPQTLQAHTQAR